MALSFEQFMANKMTYGQCASWAVWKLGACEHFRYTPNSVIAPTFYLNRAVHSLNSITTERDFVTHARDLHTKVVLVALNFAARDSVIQQATKGLAFHAFHEETTQTSDQRLRDACLGTELWGGYITDLVKFTKGQLVPVRDSQARNIRKLLRDRDFLAEQVHGLCGELTQLGCANPTIVAVGKDVYEALQGTSILLIREVLGQETKLLSITHYSKAAGIRHSDYVARVYQELRAQSLIGEG